MPFQLIEPMAEQQMELTKMAQTGFEGTFDGFVGPLANGWAWRREEPSRRLSVKLLVDGTVSDERLANMARDDLRRGGIGDGRYGYQLPCRTA